MTMFLIMSFKKFIWVSEQPPRADTSALAAINRALHSVARLFCESFLSGRAQSVKFVLQDSGGNSDGYS